eukprot:TRINITY_DN4696_c0_g1_i4.p1 TRINITY_DN4696_c0_g1~~TRINITY_DN4696_c0_g1_i4.p1  ORF type:complete len:289 (-),score=24.16 TRINITY_DN4696_c0_g1_i4:394-1260(-)
MDGLITDMNLLLLKMLTPQDVASLEATCRRWRTFITERNWWKQLSDQHHYKPLYGHQFEQATPFNCFKKRVIIRHRIDHNLEHEGELHVVWEAKKAYRKESVSKHPRYQRFGIVAKNQLCQTSEWDLLIQREPLATYIHNRGAIVLSTQDEVVVLSDVGAKVCRRIPGISVTHAPIMRSLQNLSLLDDSVSAWVIDINLLNHRFFIIAPNDALTSFLYDVDQDQVLQELPYSTKSMCLHWPYLLASNLNSVDLVDLSDPNGFDVVQSWPIRAKVSSAFTFDYVCASII